jgi:LPXTG-motif cell wall-anchored protein
MKPKGLVSGTLAVLLITALSAAVATAQNAGPSPAMNIGNVDPGTSPGTKQASMFVPGQTNTTGTQQTVNPQPKQPRQKDAHNKNNAAPTEAAPSTGNPTNPGGKGPVDPTYPSGGDPGGIKELPKTGGATLPMSSIVGVMLVAGGLLVRKALR